MGIFSGLRISDLKKYAGKVSIAIQFQIDFRFVLYIPQCFRTVAFFPLHFSTTCSMPTDFIKNREEERQADCTYSDSKRLLAGKGVWRCIKNYSLCLLCIITHTYYMPAYIIISLSSSLARLLARSVLFVSSGFLPFSLFYIHCAAACTRLVAFSWNILLRQQTRGRKWNPFSLLYFRIACVLVCVPVCFLSKKDTDEEQKRTRLELLACLRYADY